MTAVLLGAAVHAWLVRSHIDFQVFHTAAQRALAGGPLYLESDGDMPFKYAPVVALLLSPLGFFSKQVAVLFWLMATAVLMVRFLRKAQRLLVPNANPWAVCGAALLVGPFFTHLIRLGQVDVFILALAVESELQRKKRPVLSGALLGLCCAIKLPFLLLPALALLQRDWRRVSAFVGSTAGLLLMPVLRYGWRENLTQLWEWQALLGRTTTPLLCSSDNQSVFGIACEFLAVQGHPLFWWLSLGVGGVLSAVLLGWGWLSPRVERRHFTWAVALYLTAVLSPLGWRTNLVAMAPLFLLAIDRLWATSSRWAYLALLPAGLNAALGLIGFELLGRTRYLFLIDHKAFGLLGMAAALGAAWAIGALRSPAAQST